MHPMRPRNQGQGTSAVNFLEGAHDFTIGHATLVAQNPDSSSAALLYLSKKAMPGAMLDSAERSYPPRCDPDTRQLLRHRIVEWGTGELNHWRLLWLSGPAGVGKSAVAQTVAEEFRDMGRLGATVFFSRPNHRDDPKSLIPTLAYQLAIQIPQYKHIVTQRLADDPLIFDKTYRAQLRELIIDPFNILMTQHEETVLESFLIVIDGLDECNGRAVQREFVEIIGRHASSVTKFPLIWMICSRPEPHLKAAFSNGDQYIICHRERLDVDDDEARQDGWRMLRRGFAAIRRNYDDQLSLNWPPSRHLHTIADIASGHLGFIAFILRFIEDEEYSDPEHQLEVCIDFLQQRGQHNSVVNPLEALDLLYHQILSDIPSKDISTTMLILGIVILYPSFNFTAQNVANFLELSQASFYRSLRYLHSVIYVPPAPKALLDSLRIYHASFSDFLRNPQRSGAFHLDEGVVHHTVALKSIQWQKYAMQISHGEGLSAVCWRLLTVPPLDPYAQVPRFHWSQGPENWDIQLFSLNRYAAKFGWTACCQLPDAKIQDVIAELESFDFSRLQSLAIGFPVFLRWLSRLGNTNNNGLIRVITDDRDLGAIQGTSPHTDDSVCRVHTYNADNFHGFVSPFLSALGYSDGVQAMEPMEIKFWLGGHNPVFTKMVIYDRSPFIPPLDTPSPREAPLVLPLATPPLGFRPSAYPSHTQHSPSVSPSSHSSPTQTSTPLSSPPSPLLSTWGLVQELQDDPISLPPLNLELTSSSVPFTHAHSP